MFAASIAFPFGGERIAAEFGIGLAAPWQAWQVGAAVRSLASALDQLAEGYGMRSTPAMKVFKGGKPVKAVAGALPPSALEAMAQYLSAPDRRRQPLRPQRMRLTMAGAMAATGFGRAT